MTAKTDATTPPTLEARSHDESLWPSDRGPWFENADGIYDHGAYWCGGRNSHPQNQQGGYPHPDHGPAHYCYTAPQYPRASDVKIGLNGPSRMLTAYMAQPFRHGEPVAPTPWEGPRLVIKTFDGDLDADTSISMSLGDAALFIRHIEQAIAQVLGHVPVWGQ